VDLPSTYETVEVSSPLDGVLLVTLNRPDCLNAMNAQLVEELRAVLDTIRRDPSCRIVILTGAGRGFCSGFDLTGYGEVPDIEPMAGAAQRAMAMQTHIAGLIPALRALRQPVIAAVNGPAVGGGLALVLGSDVRVAAVSATFGIGFVRIGLTGCDVSTSWTLPKLVGVGRAHELMLTGRVFGAEEALRYGLVVDVVELDALLGRVLDTAGQIMANSPAGVALTKEVMWSALEIPGQRAAMDLENRTQVLLLQTADHTEARLAFLERRDPMFENR
jgi:enoyl-CoA hydratase